MPRVRLLFFAAARELLDGLAEAEADVTGGSTLADVRMGCLCIVLMELCAAAAVGRPGRIQKGPAHPTNPVHPPHYTMHAHIHLHRYGPT